MTLAAAGWWFLMSEALLSSSKVIDPWIAFTAIWATIISVRRREWISSGGRILSKIASASRRVDELQVFAGLKDFKSLKLIQWWCIDANRIGFSISRNHFFCRPHERKVARSFDSGQLVSLFHHYVVFRTVESRAPKSLTTRSRL